MPSSNAKTASKAAISLLARFTGLDLIYGTVTDGIDILNAVTNRSDRQDISKQLDKLSNTLSRTYEATIQAEFRNAAPNDIEAAEVTLAQLFTQLEPAAFVLESVIDSERLERSIREGPGRKPRADLGSEESIAIFDALLRRTCAQMAEIAVTLSDFQAMGIRSLLRSTDMLVKKLESFNDAIVATARPSSRSATDADYSVYSERYSVRIARLLDELSLPGLDLAETRRRYALTPAYVHLGLSSTFGSTEPTLNGADMPRLIRAYPHILLVGPAGSGKTTLIKWLAVGLSRRESGIEPLAGVTPVIIKLRNLTHGNLPTMDGLGEPYSTGILARRPPDWPALSMDAGKVLIILDGLDEIDEDHRGRIGVWLEELIEQFPNVRTLVSSRPAAIRGQHEQFPGWRRFTLEPMNIGQVESLVELWHETVTGVEQSKLSDQEIRQMVRQSSATVLRSIQAENNLRRLAELPLLTAMLCAFMARSDGALPLGRRELYSRALSMFLARRDFERTISQTGLRIEEIERLFQAIALDCLLNGTLEVSRARVTAVVTDIAANFSRPIVREISPSRLVDALVLRTGLLIDVGPDKFEFMHKSFLEFLAARALVHDERFKLISRNVSNDEWRDVIIWASSFMSAKQIGRLVEALEVRVRRSRIRMESQSFMALMLSVSDVAVELPGKAQKIVDRVAQALFPLTDENASVLLQCGEAAIPYLRNRLSRGDLSNSEIVTVVRALLEIGGRAAYDVLALMTREQMRLTYGLLGGFWAASGGADFAAIVLSRIPADLGPKVRVIVPNVRELGHLGDVSEVFDLTVSLSDLDVASLEGLKVDRLITELHLRLSDLTNVHRVLACFIKVHSLTLDVEGETGNQLSLSGRTDQVIQDSVTAEASAFAARWLRVRRSRDSTPVKLDESFLDMFGSARTVELIGNIDLRDIFMSIRPGILHVFVHLGRDGVAPRSFQLPRLQTLHVYPWLDVDLRALSGLSQLRSLSLPESDDLVSTDGLEGFDSLRYVNFRRCLKLRDIASLALLRDLESADLTDCPIDLAEIGYLYGFEGGYDRHDYVGQSNYSEDIGQLWLERWSEFDLTDVTDIELAARGWDDWTRFAMFASSEGYDPLALEDLGVDEDGYPIQTDELVVYDSFEEWEAGSERLPDQ